MPQAQPIIERILEESKMYNRIYISSIHEDLGEADIKRFVDPAEILSDFCMKVDHNIVDRLVFWLTVECSKHGEVMERSKLWRLDG